MSVSIFCEQETSFRRNLFSVISKKKQFELIWISDKQGSE